MYAASHPRPFFSAKPLRPRRLRVRSSLNPLECAVLDKHRVLPCFSRNRAPTSTLECALARALIHKSFRMRSSEKSGGMGYSRLFLSPNSFPCHTSESSPVSEHPERMPVPSDHRESRGHSDLVGRDLIRALNPFAATLAENHLVSPIIATLPKSHSCKSFACHRSETPRGSRSLRCLGYLLMSSFASRRLSRGWRNGFVASGAPLMACVISLAAVGKSPVFDEIRASARWLIQ